MVAEKKYETKFRTEGTETIVKVFDRKMEKE